MKKRVFNITGILIIVLGIGMFFVGASAFTYQGNFMSAFMSMAGKFSFSYWFLTIIIGIGVIILGKIIAKDN